MSFLAIGNQVHDRYDLHSRGRGVRMVRESPESIEARLRAGAWLTPGEAAAVLGVDRRTVDHRLRDGRIRYRNKPGSTHRECHPGDVLRLLAERRQVHGELDGLA